MVKNIKALSSRERSKLIERALGVFAVLTIIVAWFIGGALKGAALELFLPQAMPSADHFSEISSDLYAGENAAGQVIGYVAVGEASGYGGPMRLAVAVDLDGQITGLSLIDHKETPSYLERVFRSDFVSNLLGKSYDERFTLEDDLDGVTSATYSSAAIAEAVKLAGLQVAKDQLNLPIPAAEKPQIIFGLPEIMLIALFAVGYLGRRRVIKKTRVLRWVTMLTGMVLLGFVFNRPLTLAKVNMFLMGYFPQWQTNLYWYILMGAILFVFTADNRNPYCEWFCPFGAAQECMGAIGGAKPRFSRNEQRALDWLQRGITWLAIILALLMRNPGVTSYEIFGTLFHFTGDIISFAVLGLVLVASMISHRFWCRSLCPMRPVEGMIRLVRGWILEIWQTKIAVRKAS